MKRVLDVLPRAELAGPAAAGQLAGRVFGHANEREQSDLLITHFELVVVADRVTERGKGVPEGRHGLDPSNAHGPGVLLAQVRPPPVVVVPGYPRDAVVVVILWALDLVGLALESRKHLLQSGSYHS